MGEETRLRQVALVATDLDLVTKRLETELGLSAPYHDPGVAEFGLRNAVYAIGDCFLEVVSPVRSGTTAGRYLERRGSDSGYMAIFQVPDMAEARRRVRDVGVRVVWTADLPDMAATHLHPKDVPGAIVSLDWARPTGSWRWAGPGWAGQVPQHAQGGIVGVTVAAVEPVTMARCWASVMGLDCDDAHPATPAIPLDRGRQTVWFTACADPRSEAIAEVAIVLDETPPRLGEAVLIGGVRFVPASRPEEESS